MDGKSRIDKLKSLLGERILVIDGAVGTAIQDLNLGPEDFGGPEFEGCNEYLVLTRPELIATIHQSYLDAGADILETDTFGATAVVLAEYDLAHEARRINREAAKIARGLADAASTEEKPRFVAGSMGPTTKSISVTGGINFEDLAESYREQALGLIEGGADLLLLETSQDTINVKAGLDGIAGNADDATFSRAFNATVNAVNDVPTLDAIANPAAISEDAGQQTVNLSGISAGGGESQALTVTVPPARAMASKNLSQSSSLARLSTVAARFAASAGGLLLPASR